LLESEILRVLKDHKMLMVGWANGVDLLWMKTRSSDSASNHPWFDLIGSTKQWSIWGLKKRDLRGIAIIMLIAVMILRMLRNSCNLGHRLRKSCTLRGPWIDDFTCLACILGILFNCNLKMKKSGMSANGGPVTLTVWNTLRGVELGGEIDNYTTNNVS
ncbi:hypothetical protein VP01_1576g2, partial [Puccinia sorghi]